MHVLLSEPDTRKYYDTYTDFQISVFRFQMYCALGLGKGINDYSERINALEDSFKELTKGTSFIEMSLFRGCVNRMRETAKHVESVHAVAEECEKLVRGFLFVDENRFRIDYLDACAQRGSQILIQKTYFSYFEITL